jgi:uncharacterized protein YegP (UPF0339 family)
MRFIVKPARRGRLRRKQHRVILVADNGETLLSSEGYNNETDALAMVKLVQRDAADAPITYS